jgi:hypothetical protein
VRQADEQRRRVADQKTLISPEASFAPGGRRGAQGKEEIELVTRSPERQFIAPPGARSRQPKEADNPHPSRSLWHYTDKHPAVKRQKHV